MLRHIAIIAIIAAISLAPLSAYAQSDAANTPINQTNDGSTPRPDPTTLTTQAVDRAKEEMDEKLELREKLFNTRMKALEQAVAALHEDDNPALSPYVLNQKILDLVKLVAEKFKGVADQFALRDVKTEELAKAYETALQAALAAQKEAVAEQNKSSSEAIKKSEDSATEQMTQQRLLSEQRTRTNAGQIDDLKSRVGVVEGRTQNIGDSVGAIADLKERVSSVEIRTQNVGDSVSAIDGLKSRVGAIEGRSKGVEDSWALIAAIIAGVISLLAVVASVAAIISKR